MKRPMFWCTTCGETYRSGPHNCGYVTITKDRLRELENSARVADTTGRTTGGEDSDDR